MLQWLRSICVRGHVLSAAEQVGIEDAESAVSGRGRGLSAARPQLACRRTPRGRTLERDALPTVQLQDPAGHVVQEEAAPPPPHTAREPPGRVPALP